MGGARNSPSSWISAAAKRVDSDGNVDNSMSVTEEREHSKLKSLSDIQLSLAERALAAAGAAVVSAVIVNPLDVAKVRLFVVSLLLRCFNHLRAQLAFRLCFL